jgi:RND family efflux transporter MFP subunit
MKNRLSSSFPLLAATATVALSLGAGLSLMPESRAASKTEAQTLSRRALAVEIVTPRRQNWERTLTVSGSLHAWQEAIVASELGGLAIRSLEVDVGSTVRKGQVLARLSQDAIQATLASQQANVARSRALLAEASAHAERAEKLKETGALSEQQIQQLQLAAEAARAGLAAAEAAQRAEEVRLRQTVIQAVDHGVISSRTATLGAVVQPGSELFRLVRQGRVEWRAELTAEQLAEVRSGQKTRVRLSDGRTVQGKVRMISPTLDSTNRKALAYIDLATDSTVHAGMFGQGEIDIGRSDALTLPHSAIVLRDGNTYVFEVLANHQVEQRKLKLGRHLGDEVEILAGLDEKARVVVRGGAFLNPRDHVQVTAMSPTKAAVQ